MAGDTHRFVMTDDANAAAMQLTGPGSLEESLAMPIVMALPTLREQPVRRTEHCLGPRRAHAQGSRQLRHPEKDMVSL
jgi:hypothetical protein